MSALEREARLRRRLEEIPEFLAAGFRVEAELDGGAVVVLRGRTCRGRWRATPTEDGFAWIANNSDSICRMAETEDEAVRQTLKMVLNSLQVSLRRKREPAPEAERAPPGVVATYASPVITAAGARYRTGTR